MLQRIFLVVVQRSLPSPFPKAGASWKEPGLGPAALPGSVGLGCHSQGPALAAGLGRVLWDDPAGVGTLEQTSPAVSLQAEPAWALWDPVGTMFMGNGHCHGSSSILQPGTELLQGGIV